MGKLWMMFFILMGIIVLGILPQIFTYVNGNGTACISRPQYCYTGPMNVVTRDMKGYMITTYSSWDAANPSKFSENCGSADNANHTLDKLVFGCLEESIYSLDSSGLLYNDKALDSILDNCRSEINHKLGRWGIYLETIKIACVMPSIPQIQSISKKMSKTMETRSSEIAAMGREEYEMFVSDTDLKVSQLVAEAAQKSEKIRKEADAEVLKIYLECLSLDPELYDFWRTLKAYENSIDESTVIYMNRENSYLNIFFNGE
jgi:membrane protease subunit HflC